MRRSAVILAGLVLAGAAAGDDSKPGGRYAVQPSDDGFIRLDTQTGTVSHCGRHEGVWFCEKLTEDRTALEQRIDELAAKVADLSRQVETLAARLPRAAEQSAKANDNPGFTTRLMRRFYAFIRRMKGADAGT
jgi:outer membrane murein-binding lipoprotein Lpp